MTVLTAEFVITPDIVVRDGEVHIDNGRIVDIKPATGRPQFHYLSPGFIDLQVNGIDDVDVADLNRSRWASIRTRLSQQGVTGWCPTLITTTRARYEERLAVLTDVVADSSPGPEFLGVHLEGPFLGDKHGAHSGVPAGPVDLDWIGALPDLVSVMTLGPERSNAPEAISLLASKRILPAVGHTAASYEQTMAAIDAGARLFTHCFNAASPLHHRDPGPIGAALATDAIAVSVIADNVHLHPSISRIVFNCKPADGVVLITDATAWRSGRLGRHSVELVDGAPRLPDGTLAGSCLTMNVAVRNAVGAGIEPSHAFRAASTSPARLLGRSDIGVIEVGARANVVALDAEFNVSATWIDGVRQARADRSG